VTSSDGLTLSEAAAATGKHRQTLVRALSTGKFPNARKAGPSHAPVWRIPAADLQAAGYDVSEPKAAPATPGTALAPIAGDLVVLIQETTNAQRDAAEARAALEIERERHRHALERATSRTSRPDLAVLGALGTGGYAVALALDALDPLAVTAIPATLAVALALYAAYAAYRK